MRKTKKYIHARKAALARHLSMRGDADQLYARLKKAGLEWDPELGTDGGWYSAAERFDPVKIARRQNAARARQAKVNKRVRQNAAQSCAACTWRNGTWRDCTVCAGPPDFRRYDQGRDQVRDQVRDHDEVRDQGDQVRDQGERLLRVMEKFALGLAQLLARVETVEFRAVSLEKEVELWRQGKMLSRPAMQEAFGVKLTEGNEQ